MNRLYPLLTSGQASNDATLDPLPSSKDPQINSIERVSKKRARAYKPRARTGCITCKIRRVKCDETRPQCLRCIRLERPCDGYEERTSSPRYQDLLRRPILPKFEAGGLASLAPRGISKSFFANQGEQYLFTFYCLETSNELSGTLRASIWNRVLLQASDDESCLRYGIIVIGALSRSMKIGVARNTPNEKNLLAPKSNTEWIRDECLLYYYDKFLRGSRNALSKRTYDKRLALIICLVVICIERLQWRLFAAIRHVRSGLVLLDEWIHGRNKGQVMASPTPLTDPVDGEIVQQFRNLDVEASLFVDSGVETFSRLLRYEKSHDIMSMPQTFNTISEARSYLEVIVQRTRKFIRDLRPDKRLRHSPFYGLETTPDCSMHIVNDLLPSSHIRLTCQSKQPHGLLSDSLERPWTITSASRFQQESYASENRRWSAAFTPLHLSYQTGDQEYLGAHILKLQSLALTINLAGCLSPSELIYDSLFSQFTQIVSLAKSYLTHPCASKFLCEGSFSLTTGLIYPLQLVLDKCRDRKLRRQALALLKSKPWREGSWSSMATAQIGTWFMKTEEEGIETEWIPEQARLRLIESDFIEEAVSHQCRRGIMRCLRGIGEKVELKVVTFDWPVEAPDGLPWSFYGSRNGQASPNQ